MQDIFNTDLFKNGKEPLPNLVFNKKFDAYFFMEYPPFQYNPTEVYNPFPFLNNTRNANRKNIYLKFIFFNLEVNKNFFHEFSPNTT